MYLYMILFKIFTQTFILIFIYLLCYSITHINNKKKNDKWIFVCQCHTKPMYT